MTDPYSPDAPHADLSDDERALSNAIGLPRAPTRSDAAFRARVTSEARQVARRRRFAIVLPALAGAGALAAVVLVMTSDAATPSDGSPHMATALAVDDEAPPAAVGGATEDLAEEEALRRAALDEIAVDDDDTLVSDDLDDDSLLALGAILDARLARVATR